MAWAANHNTSGWYSWEWVWKFKVTSNGAYSVHRWWVPDDAVMPGWSSGFDLYNQDPGDVTASGFNANDHGFMVEPWSNGSTKSPTSDFTLAAQDYWIVAWAYVSGQEPVDGSPPAWSDVPADLGTFFDIDGNPLTPFTTATPTLTSFTPTVADVGTDVVLTGTNLTGATSVTFDGHDATFTVDSPTQITATVPTGPTGTNVTIAVTTPGGTASHAGFTPLYLGPWVQPGAQWSAGSTASSGGHPTDPAGVTSHDFQSNAATYADAIAGNGTFTDPAPTDRSGVTSDSAGGPWHVSQMVKVVDITDELAGGLDHPFVELPADAYDIEWEADAGTWLGQIQWQLLLNTYTAQDGTGEYTFPDDDTATHDIKLVPPSDSPPFYPASTAAATALTASWQQPQAQSGTAPLTDPPIVTLTLAESDLTDNRFAALIIPRMVEQETQPTFTAGSGGVYAVIAAHGPQLWYRPPRYRFRYMSPQTARGWVVGAIAMN